MKKCLAHCSAVIATLLLVACGSDSGGDNSDDTSVQEPVGVRHHGDKYAIETYPAEAGGGKNLQGLWVAVGEYQLTSPENDMPVTVNYKIRDVFRVTPSADPGVSNLHMCSAIGTSPLTIPVSESSSSFNLGIFTYSVVNNSVIEIDIDHSEPEGQIRGHMTAHKIVDDYDKPVGSINISASTDAGAKVVDMFVDDKFPVVCFGEQETHDKSLSWANLFADAVSLNDDIYISARHEMNIEFGRNFMSVRSEILAGVYGETSAGEEPHVANLFEIYKNGSPEDEDLPPENKFFMIPNPKEKIENVFSQDQVFESTFYTEQLDNSKDGKPGKAQGSVVLDAYL
jgi:hypothetical protein